MARVHITKTNPSGTVGYCEDFSIHLGHEFKENEESYFTAWCPGIRGEVIEGLGSVGVAIDIVQTAERENCARVISELLGRPKMSWDEVTNLAPTLVVHTPELDSQELAIQKARAEAIDEFATSLGHSLLNLDDWAVILRKAARNPKLKDV